MSSTNQYGSRDASMRYMKKRGQVRWASKKQGIQTTLGGGSGSFSSPASNMIDGGYVGMSEAQCKACGNDTIIEVVGIVEGDKTIIWNTNGLSLLTFTPNKDDGTAPLNIGSFYYNGYDAGSMHTIYWSANNTIRFGNLFDRIDLGNDDRKVINAYYTGIITYPSYTATTIYIEFTDIWSDSPIKPGKMKIRFIRNTSTGEQYIEVCVYQGSGGANGGQIATSGFWGAAMPFASIFGTTFNASFPADNTSYVLFSNDNGVTWQFTNHAYVNL